MNKKHTQDIVEENCVFCDRGKISSKILYDYGDVIVFEPLNPVCEGHLLVVPIKHSRDFAEDARTTGHVMEVASLVAGMNGGDYNLITSKGKNATQTVMHMHIHLVPRKEGDGLSLPWDDKQSHQQGLKDGEKKAFMYLEEFFETETQFDHDDLVAMKSNIKALKDK